jgi:hypothetical protein
MEGLPLLRVSPLPVWNCPAVGYSKTNMRIAISFLNLSGGFAAALENVNAATAGIMTGEVHVDGTR